MEEVFVKRSNHTRSDERIESITCNLVVCDRFINILLFDILIMVNI